jgi:tyrosine aminotransferase
LVFSCLVDKGQNLLIPTPGFSLYETIAGTRGFETRAYNLLPEKNWEADLAHIESLIDENTAGILVNNPSNPCGSVYSKEHLTAILELCQKYKVPVIADEIYGDMTFGENKFFPMATLTKEVPVISVRGLAKQWLVPGWRVGWIMFHDRHDRLAEIKKGVFLMAQVVLGPNTLVQAAIPEILANTPEEFYRDTIDKLEVNFVSLVIILLSYVVLVQC